MRATGSRRGIPATFVVLAVVLTALMAPFGISSASAQTDPTLAAGPPDAQTRIVGGTESDPWTWPAMVAVMNRHVPDNFEAQFCGGTLVDARWVLTAAHCMFRSGVPRAPSDVDVLVGTQDLDSGGTRVRVDEIRVLPGWNAATDDHDAALLHLTAPVAGPLQALPAQGSSVAAGTSLVATGWGLLQEGSEDFPSKLRQVGLTQVSDSACSAVWGRQFNKSSMTCAGAPGKDTCQGDSGGPLLVRRNNQWVQVGITSFGVGCANDGIPGIYTRVASYTSWIRQTIGLHPFSSPNALVDAAYRDLFNRAPTAAERFYGVSALNASPSGGAFLSSLISGSAYQARMGGLTRSYSAYFLRDPDQSGLDYWFTKVNAGWSTAKVSDFFARSSEFTNRYGSLDNGAFVDLVYQNVLNRPADASGRAYWVGQLDSGRKTRGQVMVGYSESNEYKTATNGRVNVIISTYALLRRPPTPSEITSGQGKSNLALVTGLFGSWFYLSRY